MAGHRFYLGQDALPNARDDVTLTGDVAYRITRVLRMHAGERLALFSGVREFECELIETGKRVRARLLEELPPQAERTHLTLYQALIRPNRFEWLIEKVTELGVDRIVPLLTERAAVRASEIGASRLERWRRIAIEATEQSGRRCVPAIAAPVSYAAALNDANGCRVFAWEGLCEAHGATIEPDRGGISLFVGPEGGWSDAEVEQARAAAATFMGLGPTTLRAETAAIVAAAILLLD